MKPLVYECIDCKARGVRLWREYQTFLENQELRCRACALKAQKKTEEEQAHTDQIGWLVPAVPTELPLNAQWQLEGESTFWGYTSVPNEGVDWWKALPVAVSA